MKLSKLGEQLFFARTTNQGYQVEDLSSNPIYWPKDIDFKVLNPSTGNSRYFEIKTDTLIHRTGNLFIETWSRDTMKENNHKGWYYVTEADYLTYIDWHNRVMYSFLMDELRELINNNNYYKRTCGEESEGYIVPLKDILTLSSVVVQ